MPVSVNVSGIGDLIQQGRVPGKRRIMEMENFWSEENQTRLEMAAGLLSFNEGMSILVKLMNGGR